MSFLPALFGIARFAIHKWSNAKRVADREQAKNSGAAQIIQTVAARALSDRRQRSRLLQGYGGCFLGVDIANCDVKAANSAGVSRNIKSSGKRSRLRLMASLKR